MEFDIFDKLQIAITITIFMIYHYLCDCAPISSLGIDESIHNSVQNIFQENLSDFHNRTTWHPSGNTTEAISHQQGKDSPPPTFQTMDNVSMEISNSVQNSSEEIVLTDSFVAAKQSSIGDNFSPQTDHPDLSSNSTPDQSDTDTHNNNDDDDVAFLSNELLADSNVQAEDRAKHDNNSYNKTPVQNSTTIPNSTFENEVQNPISIDNDTDTAVSEIFTSLQNPSSTSDPQMNITSGNLNSSGNGNGKDVYVDKLYQSFVLHGAPDSFNEDDPMKPSAIEQTENITVTEAEVSSFFHQMAPVSVFRNTENMDVSKLAETKSDDESISSHITSMADTVNEKHQDISDPDKSAIQSDSPIDFPDRKNSDIIQLPNGVVIDALFDNIDSLQDLLDVCEEGLRQRLVIRKDVFFGDSQKLAESDEDVQIRTGSLSDNLITQESAAELRRYNQQKPALGTTARNNPNNLSTIKWATTVLHIPTDDNLDLVEEKFDEDDDDENQGDTTEDETIDVDNYLTRTVLDSNASVGNTTDSKGGRKVKEGNRADDHSYYVMVARCVIKRLSSRLKYLERSIEECNVLTKSITTHEILP